jgi:catechol 2,3-dioxygenase-like lactoylglutathione lyase family enzyme
MRTMSRVILFVSDTKRMTEFYRDVIGLGVKNVDGTGFVILDAGGCQLCLHQAEREELLKKGARMKKIVRFGSIAFCDGSDPEGNIFQISTRV